MSNQEQVILHVVDFNMDTKDDNNYHRMMFWKTFEYLRGKLNNYSRPFSCTSNNVVAFIMKKGLTCVQVDRNNHFLILSKRQTLLFYDLDTRRKLFDCQFKRNVEYFKILDGQLFICSCERELFSYRIERYDYKQIVKTKRYWKAFVWESRPFKQVSGFDLGPEDHLIYLCDVANSKVITLSFETGKEAQQPILPTIPKHSNLIFTSNGDLLIAGYQILSYFSKKSNIWLYKNQIAITMRNSNNNFYPEIICYEKSTERIFIHNRGQQILVFDQEMKKIEEINGFFYCCGMTIDEKTGFLYFLKSKGIELKIYK